MLFIFSIMFDMAKSTELVSTVVFGGLGSIVASIVSEHHPTKLKVLALPDASLVTGNSQEVFRHYVFEADADTAAHIPEGARRVLSPLDEARTRELRARLLQRINR